MLTPMRIRSPDKPIRIIQEQLLDFDKLGGFISTVKYDGFRSILDWDGSHLEFYSRRGMDRGGPTVLPVCHDLKSAAYKFVEDNKIPGNTRLDGEWMARRTEGPEKFIVFGIQYYNSDWIGCESERIRWNLIKSFKYSDSANNSVALAESSEKDHGDLFRKVRDNDMLLPEKLWTTEGIVLKQEDSKLIGNLNHSEINGGWFKAKWRDAASGRDINTF